MGKSKNSSRILAAAFTGALIGSAVAVLYAPRSGKETRLKISDEVDSTTRKLNDAAVDLKEIMAEKLEKHGKGIGYLVGSVIARSAVSVTDILRALEKELEELKV